MRHQNTQGCHQASCASRGSLMEFTNHRWSDNYSFDSQTMQNIQKKLIDYEMTELKNNEDVLKVLTKSNYQKCFCPIEILAIFNKTVTQPAPIIDQHVTIIDANVVHDEQLTRMIQMEEDMFVAQHLSNYDQFHHFRVSIGVVSMFHYFRFIMF